MSVDYDLVAIDRGNVEALEIATKAAKLKARVALVTQSDVYLSARSTQIAAQICQRSQQKSGNSFAEIMSEVLRGLNPQEDFESLQALGIDLILGAGKFIDRNCFEVNQRKLRSRSFAIARDLPTPRSKKILGFELGDHLTFDRLWQLDQLPKSLAIIGGDGNSCSIAQMFNHLGVKVTLLVASEHIIPDADVETARLLQAKLEVDGIEIYTGNRVTAIAKIGSEITSNRWRLWSGNFAMDCDRILHSSNSQTSIDLNLGAARVKFDADHIPTNSKLQTTNPRIYLCQSQVDREIILQNVLFLPIAKAKQKAIPLVINTNPELAGIGLTEIEARLKYGRDLYVLRDRLPEIGFCKILCRGNGEIIGAHAVGIGAKELISPVSIAISSNLKISQLSDVSLGAISQLATQLADRKYKLDRNKQLRLESWFNFRREYNF